MKNVTIRICNMENLLKRSGRILALTAVSLVSLFLLNGERAEAQAQVRAQSEVQNEAQTSSLRFEAASDSEGGRTPWSANYLFMYRAFAGDLSGDYLFQPTKLSVGMHRFTLNYDLSDQVFLSASTRYQKNEITLSSTQGFPGAPAQMDFSTEGLSDSLLGVNRQWKSARMGHLTLSSNFSVPTGSYREQTGSGRLISYPGQLGSGTVDWVPSLSYRAREGDWELSSRVEGRVRTGRNGLGYRLGDEFSASFAGSYWVIRYLALTASTSWRAWGAVKGSENVDRFNQQAALSSRPRPSVTGPARGGYAGRGYAGREEDPKQSMQSANTADVFAVAGTRLSTQVGLRSGIYLGPRFMAGVELGWPVHVKQTGPLEGLNPTWYVLTHLRSQF